MTEQDDPQHDLVTKLHTVVGAEDCITLPQEMRPYVTDQRGRLQGKALMVVKPTTLDQVVTVVRLCAAARVAMVPQGGNTSLVGGSIPSEQGNEIVISLAKMNRIRAITKSDFTITVEAGCTLTSIHAAAEQVDRRFPLHFAAERMCHIGGCLSTNAGGFLTLRYGNARDLVLGLEVVLPDGRIWPGLRRLYKDNTGYDLKQLFIGAEGTLGIITAAVLKLFPCRRRHETAFVGLSSAAAAVELLEVLRQASGDTLTAFELVSRMALEMALRHGSRLSDPLPTIYPWYGLIELSTSACHDALAEILEESLSHALSKGVIRDMVIAAHGRQATALWSIREALVIGQKQEGASLKNDVAVPLSSVATFIDQAIEAVTHHLPGARPVVFGHIGDGNIHFNISQPPQSDGMAFLARWDEIQTLINDIVLRLEGTISAEHGIGRIKKHEMVRMKESVELDMMRHVKKMLDPHQLMNPGKVIEEEV